MLALKIEMLRCFCAVAKEGSLAGAADSLGKTVSAVSMMLSQFESRLGAPLFESERKSRLTPLGISVLKESEQAVAAFDRSILAISRHAETTSATVRIASVPSASAALLPGVIRRFGGIYPEVRLEISDADSPSVRRRLQMDEADIGIASERGGADLRGRVLMSDRLGIVCRREAESALVPASSSWTCLNRLALIGNPICDLVDHPLVRRLSKDAVLFTHNMTTLLSFVRSGLGATVLGESTMSFGYRDLAFLLPDDPPVTRDVVAMSNVKRRLSPAGVAFMRILTEEAACIDRRL